MRLSDGKRNLIKNEIIRRRFEDRETAQEQKGVRMAEERILKALQGIPWKACAGYLRTSRYVDFTDAPEGKAYYSYHRARVHITKDLPCPKNASGWVFRDGPSCKYAKEVTELNEEKKEATRQISSVLHSVNTTNQLFEILPEIKPLVEHVLDKKETYPVVAIETINAVKSLIAQTDNAVK